MSEDADEPEIISALELEWDVKNQRGYGWDSVECPDCSFPMRLDQLDIDDDPLSCSRCGAEFEPLLKRVSEGDPDVR